MPRPLPESELFVIESLVGARPDGMMIEEIERGLPFTLQRRTLQRRLKFLTENGRLRVEGETSGARYFGGAPATVQTEDGSQVNALNLSRVAQKLQREVRAPRQKRVPVGYNREFLFAYQPNQTAYLTPTVRRHLASVGHPPQDELPAGTYARQILNRLLIDLSWNSSRLEGNTYSLLETERLLELGESAEGKAAIEAQMILNHKAAIEMLVENAAEIGFDRYTILNLHGLLSDNLLSDSSAEGRLRTIAVAIGGTTFHPLAVPQLISECFDQILATATAIHDPFEQAFFAMVQLPYLQPFEDVNKRVSRLAANIPLIRLNLCPISFVDVPSRDYVDGMLSVYERNRVELLREVFVWAYERSCQRYAAVRHSLGEPDLFRLRHRAWLIEVVGAVVRNAMDKKAATQFIAAQVAEKPVPERAKLREVAETELQNLHEGNFARFRVRPSEFELWEESWR